MFDINTALFFFLLNWETFRNESCCSFLMEFRIMPKILAFPVKKESYILYMVYLILAQ